MNLLRMRLFWTSFKLLKYMINFFCIKQVHLLHIYGKFRKYKLLNRGRFNSNYFSRFIEMSFRMLTIILRELK